MGMVVKTNMGAINANNALTRNNSAVNKNIEKLSTGMKINRAADDASGLAISEKMKRQIKALDTSTANCEDGISLIQTAEGYMDEVHSMLNRMVELSEKSANGTYTDGSATGTAAYDATDSSKAGTDRAALQKEMDQLCSEIDRIASTANFNGNKLMNGNIGAAYTEEDVDGKFYLDTSTVTVAKGSTTTNGTNYYRADGSKVTGDGNNATEDLYAASAMVSATGAQDTINDGGFNVFDSDSSATAQTAVAKTGGGLTLQIGETSSKDDKMVVKVEDMHTDKLLAKMEDASDLLIANASDTSEYKANAMTINISDQASASKAAEQLKSVIDNVSLTRADLGAQQNRLEHTVNNLTTASENITSANSRIRDTDMAKQMMAYTQGNVMTQAAQAMLAQANQAPQSVLQLLQ